MYEYPIQETLEICRDNKALEATAYLLDRIGDTQQSLQLFI